MAWHGMSRLLLASLSSHSLSSLVQVVNPDNVPSKVAKERPAGKKTVFHCIRFFPTGDLCVSIALVYRCDH